MTSTFYPTAIYMSDLTRCMSGLSQIFPTKFVACTITAPGKDKPIPGFDTIETKTEGEPVVDYTETRKALWKSLKALNPTGSCYGDINFIGASLEGGKNLSEVYIQIDKDTWNRPYIFQEEPADSTSLENLKDKRTTTDGTNYTEPVANMAPVERASNYSYTYNAIILYYNLYLVDPSGQSSGVKPVCTELPMGIYYLRENKKVKERSVTRLNMLIGTDKNAVPVNTGQASSSTYAALTQSLLAFSQGFEVIRKEVESPEIGKCIGGEIKQELDHFRDNCAVNVPYIKDGYWFVNGRKYGAAVQYTPEMKADVKGAAKEAARDTAKAYIEENPDKFKGKDGEDGEDGKPGEDGRNGVGLNLRADHEYTDFDDLKKNQPQDLTPGDAYVIGSDLYVWSSDKTWVKVPNFKGAKGDKGEAGEGVKFCGTVESENELPRYAYGEHAGNFYIVGNNIRIWDGKKWVNGDALRGPRGKKGEPGNDGNDGKDCTVETGPFIIPDCDEIDICLVYRCKDPEDYDASSVFIYGKDGQLSAMTLEELLKNHSSMADYYRKYLSGSSTSKEEKKYETRSSSGPVLKNGLGSGLGNKYDPDKDNLQHYDTPKTELEWQDEWGNIHTPNPGRKYWDEHPVDPAEEKKKTPEQKFYETTTFTDYDFTTKLDNIHNIRKDGSTLWPNKYKFVKKGFTHDAGNLKLPMWGFCGGGELYDEQAGFGVYKSNKKKEGNVLEWSWRQKKIKETEEHTNTKLPEGSKDLYNFIPLVKAGKILGVNYDDIKNFLQVRCLTIRPKNFILPHVLNSMLNNGECALHFSSLFHVCAGYNGGENENMEIRLTPDVDLYVCGYKLDKDNNNKRIMVKDSEHIFRIDGEMRPLKTHEGLEWYQTESRRAFFNMSYDPVSRATIIAPAGFSYRRKENIAKVNEIRDEIAWVMDRKNIEEGKTQ